MPIHCLVRIQTNQSEANILLATFERHFLSSVDAPWRPSYDAFYPAIITAMSLDDETNRHIVLDK